MTDTDLIEHDRMVREVAAGTEVHVPVGEQTAPEQPAETGHGESNSVEVPGTITDWSIEKHNETTIDKDVDDRLLAIEANRSYEKELETKQSELAKRRRRVGGFVSWFLGKKH
jgi:hypothetical protein